MFRFFMKNLKMNLSQMMVYKINFILRTITLFCFDLVFPLVTILIYQNTKGFAGWNFYQIILLQGIFIMVNGIDRMFFRRVNWRLTYDVRNGNFDRYLLFPINVLAYISFQNLAISHLAQILTGIVFIVFSVIRLGLQITFVNFLMFIASVIVV